jgi:hypothetical protein
MGVKIEIGGKKGGLGGGWWLLGFAGGRKSGVGVSGSLANAGGGRVLAKRVRLVEVAEDGRSCTCWI